MSKWVKISICLIIIFTCGLNYPLNLKAQQERDPFVSIIDLQEKRFMAKRIDLAKIVLKGIIYTDTKAVAIINDELVMAGDEFQGFKVERIDKDSVTLSDQIKSHKFYIQESPLLSSSGDLPQPEAGAPYPEGVLPFGEGGVHPQGQGFPQGFTYPEEKR